MANPYITTSTRKVLSRRAAKRAYGSSASTHQIGEAGKVIDRIITEDPKRFIEFHETFMRPKQDEIVNSTVRELKPQQTLF